MDQNNNKCGDCTFCLRLDPTSREIKAGFAESHSYCCHEGAVQRIGGESVPQLADIVRRNVEQCGPKAKWWEAAVELPPGGTISGLSASRREGNQDNRTRGVLRTPYLRPTRSKSAQREPYKLGEGVTPK